MLNVTAVRHVQDHVLWLRFSDGAEGTVDLTDQLEGEVLSLYGASTFSPEP